MLGRWEAGWEACLHSCTAGGMRISHALQPTLWRTPMPLPPPCTWQTGAGAAVAPGHHGQLQVAGRLSR